MKLAAALGFLFLSAPVASASVPGERAFTTEMLGRIRAALSTASIEAVPDEPLTLRGKTKNGEDTQYNLHRIYGFCAQAEPAACEASKAEYVQKLSVVPPKPTAASLRLIVRDRQYVDFLRAQETNGSGASVFVKPIGEDLFILLASDSPDQIAVIGESVLKELGLSPAEAWDRAHAQTRKALPALPAPEQLASSAVAYEGEEYQGSLLADLEGWARLSASVGPDLFVTVVSDQFVMAAKMPDGPDLDAFRQAVAEDCAAQPRCISPNIYRFRDGRWAIAR
jgi:hypothetical protein